MSTIKIVISILKKGKTDLKKKTILLYTLFFLIFNYELCASNNRIITLAPSQTELVYAMGLGEQIVGVSDYSDYPKDALNKTKIGDIELKVELILSLSPTIIIDVNSMRKSYEPLFRRLNLNYVNYNISEMEDIASMALEIGKCLKEEEKANKFASKWLSEVQALNLKKPEVPFTFYAEIWGTPMQAAGNKSFISKIIERSGGKNIFNSKIEYPVINKESVVSLNPNVVFLFYPIKEEEVLNVKNRPAWKHISASKNNNIYALDQDLFVRPGPRNLDGLKMINKILNKAIK